MLFPILLLPCTKISEEGLFCYWLTSLYFADFALHVGRGYSPAKDLRKLSPLPTVKRALTHDAHATDAVEDCTTLLLNVRLTELRRQGVRTIVSTFECGSLRSVELFVLVKRRYLFLPTDLTQ
jgi:hypothetical protein